MSAAVIMSFAALPPSHKLSRPLVSLAIVALCVLLVLPTARGQERAAGAATRPAPPPPAALEHYNRGRAHYQAGHYKDAVVELERALALDPASPNLVYNLARVYELLGEIDRSIAYYRRYQGMLPASESEERARTKQTLQRLIGARSQPLRAPETRTVPVVVPSERGVADRAFWTLASLSLAALAVGTLSGGLALRHEHQARDFVLGRDGDARMREQQADRADRLALTSDICFAAGAVGALTSILLYALRSQPVTTPSLAITQHGVTLSLRGAL